MANKMRWNCLESGCFNYKCRPKFHVFQDAFPRPNMNFSDVDGLVEINGQGLLMEWKSTLKELPTGQRIMYERFTATKIFTVLILVGNAKTMEITHHAYFHGGNYSAYFDSSLEKANEFIKKWVESTRKHIGVNKSCKK